MEPPNFLRLHLLSCDDFGVQWGQPVPPMPALHVYLVLAAEPWLDGLRTGQRIELQLGLPTYPFVVVSVKPAPDATAPGWTYYMPAVPIEKPLAPPASRDDYLVAVPDWRLRFQSFGM